jgi:hypothetical protein
MQVGKTAKNPGLEAAARARTLEMHQQTRMPVEGRLCRSERTAVRKPVPPAIDNLIGAVDLVHVNDIDPLALPQQDAALPPDLVGGTAIVEARQRASCASAQLGQNNPSSGIGLTSANAAVAASRAIMIVVILSICQVSKAYRQSDSGAGLSAKAWFSALPGLK